MALLPTAKRNALPKSDFGLPAQRKYPMPDAPHAKNAEARASAQVNAGRMSPSTEHKIDAKANKVLGHPGRSGGLLKPSSGGLMKHPKPEMTGMKTDRGAFRMK